jgi:hypothetical protein
MDRPSGQLRDAILAITGTEFAGHPEVDISFGLQHLRQHQTALAGLWCGLHLSLASEPNKYKTAFFLSALIFAEQSSWDVVKTLAAIANDPDKFRSMISPPGDERFDLNYKIESMRTTADPLRHPGSLQAVTCKSWWTACGKQRADSAALLGDKMSHKHLSPPRSTKGSRFEAFTG